MMLILVCGLPGTGKTTVAEAIAKKAKAAVLSTDILRKEMMNDPSYSATEKTMVYGMLFSMAEMMLKTRNVVLDGTFYRKDLRDRAREIAAAAKSGFRMVEVVCDERLIRERLEKRKKTHSASDADFAVYAKLKKAFEPIREKHAVIDTGGDWQKKLDGLLKG